MKNKRLLDLIEHIDQAYVAEATPKKRGTGLMWQRWGAVAAAFVLLIGTVTGGYYIFQQNQNNKIPNADTVAYMDYNGPILPLTAKQELEGITAERQVTYDFSAGKAAVTDRYVLKNTKDTSQTISLLYPFGASLSDDLDVLPQMTVDGAAVETTLYPGADCKLKKTGTTGEQVGWNAYQALLQDGSYQAAALADYPVLNQSVVVYEITNVVCHGEGQNPTLNMEFEMDYHKTTVMTYGMNGLKNDVEAGKYARHFSVAETGNHYLVVLGEDLKAYTLQGYQDGGCDKGEEIEITAKVNRLETTLGAFLQERLAEKRIPNSSGDLRDMVSEEVFFGLVAQHLEEGILAAEGTAKFNCDILEDIISSAHYAQRVIYVAFDVTIPAGEQITVAGAFVREGHSDYVVSGAKQGNAYDVATQLGSNLFFASQTVSVSGMETLGIKAQNLGLDLKNGITQVTLDSTEDYYWMELQEGVASDSVTEEPRDTHTVFPVETPSETPSAAPTPIPTLTPTKGSTPTKAPTKKPTATPVPTPTSTPEPTPIPPCTAGEYHDWGPWVWEKYYTLTEEGMRVCVCNNCSVEWREVEPVAPVFEAFGMSGIGHILNNTEANGYTMTAENIAMFANRVLANKYYVPGKTPNFEVSAEEYYEEIAKRINLTEDMKEELKKVTYWSNVSEGPYDPQTDTFHFYSDWYTKNSIKCEPVGYIHRGGDRYTVYFIEFLYYHTQYDKKVSHYWEVEMTYCGKSGLDSEYVPNRIISFQEIDAIPEGEQEVFF